MQSLACISGATNAVAVLAKLSFGARCDSTQPAASRKSSVALTVAAMHYHPTLFESCANGTDWYHALAPSQGQGMIHHRYWLLH